MQNQYPPERVLVSKDVPITFSISEYDTYTDIFTAEERKAIIDKYMKPNLFNGPCVRLDSLHNGHAVLSPVMFYDFLCCNIVGIHNEDPIAYNKLNHYLSKYGNIDSLSKLLSINELPNIIGVSTLLHDIDGNYLLCERNTKVSVGSGVLACTSSGSLDITDMSYNNPVIGCGLRELKEELNIQCQLCIEELVVPIQKLQPIALLTGIVPFRWKDIAHVLKDGLDYHKENTRILSIPKDKLLPIISMYSFTDAASYHIFIEADGDKDKWKKASKEFVKLSNYYI